MRVSTLTQKSISDLRRRPLRSFLTILTIAVAVAGLGIFSLSGLIGGSMRSRVSRDHIYDAWVSTADVALTPAQLGDLQRVDNVASLTARTVFRTRVWVGQRRAEAVVVGVPDFAHQPVDSVALLSGTRPVGDQVLVDPGAARAGRWHGQAGDTLRVINGHGIDQPMTVTGKGESLEFSVVGDQSNAIVMYAPQDAVRSLGMFTGTNVLEVRFVDASASAADATMAQLRRHLLPIAGANAFSAVPIVRKAGTWPGQEGVGQFQHMMSIIAFVALFSAVFLIANTMNTLVAEQRREIGVLKAVGGRKRDIKRIYRRTAVFFGLGGGLLGAALAIALANVLARYLAGLFFGVSPGWSVPLPLLVGGVALGLGVTVFSSLPAVHRSTRLSAREAMADAEVGDFGSSRSDRLLRRVRLSPMATVGIRSVTRRKGRSAATVLQVAVSIGIMISFLTISDEAISITRSAWDQFSTDIAVRADSTGKSLAPGTAKYLAAQPGVARLESVYIAGFRSGDLPFEAWGLPPGETSYRSKVNRGRWLGTADVGRPVVVIGDALARIRGFHLGDQITVTTPGGPQKLRVIGIDDSLLSDGRIAYVPLSTMQRIVGTPGAVNGFWIQSADRSDRAIDALSTAIEDRMVALGNAPTVSVFHVLKAQNIAQNRSITTTITVLGFLIVAISMIGLINAISMNVIDRTREIGVLRCIGARASDLRRAFRIEGLSLTMLGWVAGVPLGYAAAWLLTQLVFSIFQFRFTFVFSVWTVWVALIGALVVALVVMVPPLRRATRLRPGEALRYQ